MKCPRCKQEFDRLLALSRKDNKTHICDACGTVEALEAWERALMMEVRHDERSN